MKVLTGPTQIEWQNEKSKTLRIQNSRVFHPTELQAECKDEAEGRL